MDEDVKGSGAKRRYHSPRRAERAAATRQAVLASARELFVNHGYASTTVAEIAAGAGVAVDTIYATVGRKPAILRLLVETSISGTDRPVAADQRGYVKEVQASSTARQKIAVYAAAITTIQQRLAPVFVALRDAAAVDSECRALWTEIADRRAANMRLFAADLRAAGGLRADLSDEQAADIIWTMNSAEYWVLLVVDRGWTPPQFESWLNDAWCRLLLDQRD